MIAANVECEHAKRWAVYSQRDLASALAVDQGTITQWVRMGLRREKAGKNRWRYCIPCAAKFARDRAQAAAKDPLPIDDELIAMGGDSPALERYRLAKAKLAEMDIEQRRNALVPRDRIRSGLGRFAQILRQLGERLGQRYGPEATASVNDALDDCQQVIDDEFGGNGLHDDGPQ